MGKLESNFSYSFKGKVWNLILSEEGHHLVIEIRDDQAFRTSYYRFSLNNFKFDIENLFFEEEWWIGVSHATKNLILFYTYENQDNPDNKLYFTFDVARTKVLWEKAGLAITEVNDSVAESIDLESGESQFIDLNNGKTVEEMTFKPSVENKKLRYSFHYVEGSNYFITVSQFLASLLNVAITGGVDYFQYSKGVVISYYVRTGEKLTNMLIVVGLDKEILLQEILGEELPGISDNTFFIYDDNLIFVKEKHHFFIYPLTDK